MIREFLLLWLLLALLGGVAGYVIATLEGLR